MKLTGVVVKQMDEGLEKAKDSYFKSVKRAAQGLSSEYGPWVVAKDIPPGLFEVWSGKQESRWKLAYEDKGGYILLYGDPSPVHEGTSGLISQLIILELAGAGLEASGSAGFKAGGKAVKQSPSPLCQLVDSRKEPDFALKPSDCKQYNPTLVCEVAYKNESTVELRRELTRWTAREDLAQMCIGICVQTDSRVAALDPYLTIVWKCHGSRHQQLPFGKGSACTAADLPQFQFRIPFNKLFARSNLAQQFGQRDHIAFDLFEVRQEIKDILVAMP